MAGSPWSRRVARSASVRCSRTSRSTSSTSGSGRPIDSATSRAIGAPTARVRGARAGQLADVVQQAGEQQQVGPVDLGEVTLHLGHALHRVPVDGVPVDRVVLGPGADALPRREPADDAAGQIEGLPDRQQRRAAGQQLEQRDPGLVRPGGRDRRGVLAEVVGGDGGQHQAALGGQRPGPQIQQRGAGAGQPIQSDLALVDDQAVRGLGVLGSALPPDEGQLAADRQHLPGGPAGEVDGVADPAGGHADGAPQVVRVGVPEAGGDVVDLGGQQPVHRPAGAEVEGVADVEQLLVRVLDPGVRAVGQPGGGQRPQHDHVAEAAAGLLQVGLQQVGGVAERLVPLLQGGEQLGQPLAGVGPPGGQQGRPRSADELGVAGQHPQVEQPDPGAQLATGHVGALGRGAHRVVQPHRAVPQRIPEGLGQSVDPGPVPAVVQQHQVDVGARTELASGQAADRGQGDPGVGAAGTRRTARRSASSMHSVIKRRRSGPDVEDHVDRIATLRRSEVRSRFRARPARALPYARGRCRPRVQTRPCRHRCGRSVRS